MKLSNPKIVPRITEESFAHFVQPFDPTASDSERIASARLRAIAQCKVSSAPGATFGFEYPPQHYKDYAGPETSQWDAQFLLCIAGILETPILRRSKFEWPRHRYDPRTAEFELSDCPPVSLRELKEAIDARVSELSISKARLWEWYNEPSGPGQEYWRFDLQTRIKKFKWKATGE